MKTDTVIREEGMDLLLDGLGYVDAERFISLVIREPLDYTEWRRDGLEDMDVRELSMVAQAYAEGLGSYGR